MTNDEKPPMFGPSGVFDAATYEPRSVKTFWMAATDVSSLADKDVAAGALIGNCTTSIPFKFEFDPNDNGHTVMLGQLRLREAVLLYVGQDADNFAQQIAENFGSGVARAVSNSLFVLDNAPVPTEAREALRAATNHGMNRW